MNDATAGISIRWRAKGFLNLSSKSRVNLGNNEPDSVTEASPQSWFSWDDKQKSENLGNDAWDG